MKAFIKKNITPHGVIYQACELMNNFIRNDLVCAFLNNYMRWDPHPWEYDIVNAYANANQNIQFLQIGSNNGKNGDPLHDYIKRFEWKGILVEPVPYIFEELKNNYSDFWANLSFENVAIANSSGQQKFYSLKKSTIPGLPVWYDQLGSFNKNVIYSHKGSIPFFDELITEALVNTVSFKDLLAKYSIRQLNVLHIDTEGYDYEIIKMVPLAELKVDVIMFEHKHLSNNDYRQALMILYKYGYRIGTKHGLDTIAIHKTVYKTLR